MAPIVPRTPSISLLILLGLPAAADDGVAFFRDQVKPILAEHCFQCHGGPNSRGEIKIRGELQLISRKGLTIGGEDGPAIDEHQPANSLLLKMLSYADEDHEMPPRGKLPDEQIELISRWLKMGAPWTPEDADLLVEIDEPQTGITEVNETFVAPDGSWFAARTRGSPTVSGAGAITSESPTFSLLAQAGAVGCMPYIAPSGTWGFIAGRDHGIRWGHAPGVSDRQQDQRLVAPHGDGYCYHPGISSDEGSNPSLPALTFVYPC